MNAEFWRETTSCLGSVRKMGQKLLAGPVAQWITRLTTDQKIPGSDPGKVELLMIFYSFSRV